MKFFNKHKETHLIIENNLIENLIKLGKSSYPKECGGFLVGYYSNDYMTLQITDFILPKRTKKSYFSFERSVYGIKQILYNLFQTKRHYYIGEWHTHPNGFAMYSETDLNAMTEIAMCDTVCIENPILLILTICKNEQGFSFFMYDNQRLYKYE